MQPLNKAVWSFSLLERYEKCPFAAKLKYFDRIPEPKVQVESKRASTTASDKSPLERGIDVHNGCEAFVAGTQAECPAESKSFEEALLQLRGLYQKGWVEQERTWLFDREWGEVPNYKQAWGVMKLDVFVHEPNTESALIIDHKTGKLDNNRVKHAKQGAAYQTLAFHRNPKLKNIVVEFWYHDLGLLTRQHYNRATTAAYTQNFTTTITGIEQDRHFRPSPVEYKCRYCGYRIEGCEFAIEKE